MKNNVNIPNEKPRANTEYLMKTLELKLMWNSIELELNNLRRALRSLRRLGAPSAQKTLSGLKYSSH